MFSRRLFLEAVAAVMALPFPSGPGKGPAAAGPPPGPRPAGTIRFFGDNSLALAECLVTYDPTTSTFSGSSYIDHTGYATRFEWEFPSGERIPGVAGLPWSGADFVFDGPMVTGVMVCVDVTVRVDGPPGRPLEQSIARIMEEAS